MTYSRLNYIENQVSGVVIAQGTTETSWKHYGTYAKGHPVSSWTKYKTNQLVATGSSATHTLTTITQDYLWLWKNKKETISGKKNQQYYKIKTAEKKMNGFLSLIPDSYFGSLTDKYSRVYVCKDANAPAVIKANAAAEIPQPDIFNIDYSDFDSIKSGSGNDITYTTGINRSESTGYLTRRRIRTNLRTLSIGWSYLTDAQAKQVLEKINASQWMLVNFLDPLTNTDMSKTFCLTGCQIEGSYRNSYRNLSITYEEV